MEEVKMEPEKIVNLFGSKFIQKTSKYGRVELFPVPAEEEEVKPKKAKNHGKEV